jgi:hypothetical protein
MVLDIALGIVLTALILVALPFIVALSLAGILVAYPSPSRWA